jgi:FAD:protein FMN transferase
MNTAVEVLLCVSAETREAAEKALNGTEWIFRQSEESLSRFRPASELARLNSAAGQWFKASPLLFEVTAESLAAARLSGGIFDPTILPDLLACGYDRSFEELSDRVEAPCFNISRKRCRWQDIRLDAAASSVYLPAGCGLDLGGIAKGWTVDTASRGLEDYTDYAIDAGGDIRVKGRKADGTAWDIGIADPFVADRDLRVVDLPGGAICTSTTTRRQWKAAGRSRHHLIDPRSGQPSSSGVVSATVLAESAARAEVIAKAALILGAEAGLRFIESQPGAAGLLVLEDKQVLTTTGFKEPAYVD